MKYLLFILLFSTQFAFSQDWELKTSIPLEADRFIGVDKYKYRYWIKDNVLKKQVNGVVFNFSDRRLGKIQSVDIINPLSVYVFYQEAQTLVILDNKFNEVDRVVFSDIADFMEVLRIGNAGNRRLWVVNAATQRLEVLDYRSKRVSATSQSFVGDAIALFSDYNYCYIQTKDTVYVYNSYGSLLQKLATSGYERFFPANKGLVLEKNGSWYLYDVNKKQPVALSILETDKNSLKDLFYTQEAYYVFDGVRLHTYIAEK